MHRRRVRASLAAVAAVATLLVLPGCTPGACPAIGYLDTSPVQLRFSQPPPAEATVSACFDRGCTPAVVPAGRGRGYAVPQQAPYLDQGFQSPRTVRVVVATDVMVLHDATHEISLHSERTGLWGQCPGPWSYQPVEIQLD